MVFVMTLPFSNGLHISAEVSHSNVELPQGENRIGVKASSFGFGIRVS
jgi:hypothetical protein